MTFDLTSLLHSAARPLDGVVIFLLVVIGAYLADSYFSRSARR